MNLVLISVTDVGSGRFEMLERMVRSVARAADAQPALSVSILLLLQNCPEYLYWTLRTRLPSFAQAIPVGGMLSLSAARNMLLARASEAGLIEDETIVGFPDDDCWYPDGTLDHVVGAFAQSPRLDLWFCHYSSKPCTAAQAAVAACEALPRDVIRNASSNTMFVRGRVLTPGAAFDESLGVGTANGGGEDTEFALRAHLISRRSLYLPAPIVGHRDKTPQLRPKYFRGGLIAIARYARHEPRVGLELARKLSVGLWLVLTLQLPPGSFARAVAAAVRARGTSVAGA